MADGGEQMDVADDRETVADNWLDQAVPVDNMDDAWLCASAPQADRLDEIRRRASDPSLLDLPTSG